MSEETIREIFLEIAFRAMDTGKDLKLEKGKNTSTSKIFGGAVSDSNTDYDSLVLNVFQPDQAEPMDEEEEEDES